MPTLESTMERVETGAPITDQDLQRIASLTGEGSYLHQLAADQSPDFTGELGKFLTTHRYAHLAQEPHDEIFGDGEEQPVPPITYVNPQFIQNGLRQVADLNHLIQLFESRTGSKVIVMQTDYSRDA